jgi:hypothetical protein
LDLVGVVLRRRSRGEAIIVRRSGDDSKREKIMMNEREKTIYKLYSCGLWWADHENDASESVHAYACVYASAWRSV